MLQRAFNNTPGRILDHIRTKVENSKDYLYLIMGKGGPTGKTWLCEALKHEGYTAHEISEDVYRYVTYQDNENHYYISPTRKLVIIVLNKRLEMYGGK